MAIRPLSEQLSQQFLCELKNGLPIKLPLEALAIKALQ
jgi:hypothetical protein